MPFIIAFLTSFSLYVYTNKNMSEGSKGGYTAILIVAALLIGLNLWLNS